MATVLLAVQVGVMVILTRVAQRRLVQAVKGMLEVQLQRGLLVDQRVAAGRGLLEQVLAIATVAGMAEREYQILLAALQFFMLAAVAVDVIRVIRPAQVALVGVALEPLLPQQVARLTQAAAVVEFTAASPLATVAVE